MDNKRYIVHDFLMGNPILIDRKEKTISYYNSNVFAQIFNLKNPEHHFYDEKKINDLIHKTNEPKYEILRRKPIDVHIYTYLMTPEQQDMCAEKPAFYEFDKFIAASNDFTEAIKAMCEQVYEDKYCGIGGKEAERKKLLNYCDIYIRNYRKNPPPEKRPSVMNDLQEKVNEVKNTPASDKAAKTKTDKGLNG